MSAIDFEWYRSFVAVYRQGTVSRAASERALTQPAISQHLAALEAALGLTLFTRTARRMIPTDQCKRLYAQVAPAIDALEEVQRRDRVSANETRLLRIGAPQEYFYAVALDRLTSMRLACWARFDVTAPLIEALEQGELDLVIATQRLPAQGVEYAQLGVETFLLVGAPHGPRLDDALFAGDELVNVEQWLNKQAWISYGPELPIIRRFWQTTFGKRPQLRPRYILPDLRAVQRAAIAGAGISLLPDYLCAPERAAHRLEVLWKPPHPIVNDLWLAFRRGDRPTALIQEALQALQALPVSSRS